MALIGRRYWPELALSGKPPPMPRVVALPKLDMSACMPFASDCMLKCADAFARAVMPQATGFLADISQQCGCGGFRNCPLVIWARGARVRRFHFAALFALLGTRVGMDGSRPVFVIAGSFWTV